MKKVVLYIFAVISGVALAGTAYTGALTGVLDHARKFIGFTISSAPESSFWDFSGSKAMAARRIASYNSQNEDLLPKSNRNGLPANNSDLFGKNSRAGVAGGKVQPFGHAATLPIVDNSPANGGQPVVGSKDESPKFVADSSSASEISPKDDPSTANAKLTMEKVKSLTSSIKGDYAVFTSPNQNYGLVLTENGYALISPDGTTYEFSQANEFMQIATSVGTACSFVAANENFTLGKLTDEAYVLITASGQEYTLALSLNDMNVVDSHNQPILQSNIITPAISTLDALAANSLASYEAFKSSLNEYALVVYEDLKHTLIAANGSSYDFMPAEGTYILTTKEGTECALVGTGEGFSLGSLTDDAYVLLASTTQPDQYEEYTLFNADINSQKDAGYTVSGSGDGTITIADNSSASADSQSSAQTQESEALSPSTADVDIPSQDVAATTTITPVGMTPADINAPVAESSSSEEKPYWALSMAERRDDRYRRYSGI